MVQEFAFNCLMALKTSLTKEREMKVTREDATAVAQLVRAWESAQERVRINRGRPLPGTLRPKEKGRRKSGRSAIGGPVVYPSPGGELDPSPSIATAKSDPPQPHS